MPLCVRFHSTLCVCVSLSLGNVTTSPHLSQGHTLSQTHQHTNIHALDMQLQRGRRRQEKVRLHNPLSALLHATLLQTLVLWTTPCVRTRRLCRRRSQSLPNPFAVNEEEKDHARRCCEEDGGVKAPCLPLSSFQNSSFHSH